MHKVVDGETHSPDMAWRIVEEQAATEDAKTRVSTQSTVTLCKSYGSGKYFLYIYTVIHVPVESNVHPRGDLGFYHNTDRRIEMLAQDAAREWVKACIARGNYRIKDRKEADALLR